MWKYKLTFFAYKCKNTNSLERYLFYCKLTTKTYSKQHYFRHQWLEVEHYCISRNLPNRWLFLSGCAATLNPDSESQGRFLLSLHFHSLRGISVRVSRYLTSQKKVEVFHDHNRPWNQVNLACVTDSKLITVSLFIKNSHRALV